MDEILARLERIEGRLDALEARLARPAPPPAAPAPQPQSLTPPGETGGLDLEATLGAQWLPRAGAVAVIAALAYLVGLGIQRGVITPATVALGIAAVCVGVAALGARMRGAKAAFGNILVGLAAGGLYVDAVGANLYHEMLSGEATVAACMAVSLATLAFGARRALPSFLGVGLFGGLLAALMPLTKGEIEASVGLFVLVTAPTFAVAAWRRWPLAAALAWGAAFFAALPILFGKGDLGLRLVPLDLSLLMAVAAWGWSAEPLPAEDPQGAFPFAAALGTGVVALVAWHGPNGATHVAALSLALALGFALRRTAAQRVAWAGTLLALGLAPMSLEPVVASSLLVGLVLAETALAWLALRGRARPIGVLAAVQTGLALAAYGYAWARGDTIPLEAGLVGTLLLATVGMASLLDLKEASVAAGLVGWALLTRLGVLLLGLPVNAAVTMAWIMAFVLCLALGFGLRRPELRQLGLAIGAATAGKVALVDLAGLDPAMKAGVLMVLGLVLLGGGYAYVRWSGAREAEGDGTREAGTVSPPGR